MTTQVAGCVDGAILKVVDGMLMCVSRAGCPPDRANEGFLWGIFVGVLLAFIGFIVREVNAPR